MSASLIASLPEGNVTCPKCGAVTAWEGEKPDDCLRCGALFNADLWDYSFSVWPQERGFERVVYDLFRMGLHRRILAEGWTHDRYVQFREDLARNGFTLREVERVPYVLPETVH